ncbi:hypothetical protein F383_22881 [Gossypium arboreum]|uniref:Uncharacterized protein n=1 Tax=Gossypium arboreum TaxID=29729 RepID=A0A0B0NZE1_GOSAR|nr:hypothetical protein F383_22881 [Gossypium arboreum]
MSQTWSYTDYHLRGRCHVLDMVLHLLSHNRADAMSQTWSYTYTSQSRCMS